MNMPKLSIFFLSILISMVACSQSTVEQPVKLLALGDSYTIGESVSHAESWPQQFAAALEKKDIEVRTVDIVAKTGWRTDQLIEAIKNTDLAESYSMVGVLIGVNNQFQGRSVESYAPEFRQLLNTAIEFADGKKENVFVISIPDYAYTPFGQSSSPDRISEGIDEYNRVNKAIAKEMGIVYVDITPGSREAIQRPELIARDGLHPSGQMYAEWVQQVMDQWFSTLNQ